MKPEPRNNEVSPSLLRRAATATRARTGRLVTRVSSIPLLVRYLAVGVAIGQLTPNINHNGNLWWRWPLAGAAIAVMVFVVRAVYRRFSARSRLLGVSLASLASGLIWSSFSLSPEACTPCAPVDRVAFLASGLFFALLVLVVPLLLRLPSRLFMGAFRTVARTLSRRGSTIPTESAASSSKHSGKDPRKAPGKDTSKDPDKARRKRSGNPARKNQDR